MFKLMSKEIKAISGPQTILIWTYESILNCNYMYLGVPGYNLKKNALFCLNNFCTFTYSVDLGEMQHYVAFHLGLHCLHKYLFRGFG